MYQLKKGAHQTLSLHFLSQLVSLSAGLSLSLSLSNKTRIYWNVVVFAFQTQYIRGLFVRNSINTSLLICTLYSIFCTGILRLSSDFSTLSALISMKWIVHFRIKFAEKVFLQYLPHSEPAQIYNFMV